MQAECFLSMSKDCHYTVNELSNDIENIIEENEKNPRRTLDFVEKQTKKIKENAANF